MPDWGGGTRIGESLQAYNEQYGRRGLTRGAVAVVVSDGWERGDLRCWTPSSGGSPARRTGSCG